MIDSAMPFLAMSFEHFFLKKLVTSDHAPLLSCIVMNFHEQNIVGEWGIFYFCADFV